MKRLTLASMVLLALLAMGSSPDWQDQATQTIKVRLFLYDTDGSRRSTGSFRGYIAGADTSLSKNQFTLTYSSSSRAWEGTYMRNGAKIRSGWYDLYEIGGSDSLWVDQQYVNAFELAKYAVGDTTIATGAVGTRAIATDGVNSAEIADGSVTGAEIATDAVGSDEIADSITLTGATSIGADTTGKIEINNRLDLGSAVYKEFTVTSGGGTTQTFTWTGCGASWRYLPFWASAPGIVRAMEAGYSSANTIYIKQVTGATDGTVGVIAIRPTY